MKAEKDILNFKITRMKETHLEEVLQLAAENNLSYWSYEDYKDESLNDDSLCIVAENQKKETIGFLVSRLIIQESCGELYNIASKENYKRKGVGEKLLLHLINYCISNSLYQINLEVRESNRAAINLYLKFGFTEIGIKKLFYTQPSENAVTMIKNIHK